MRNFSQSKLHSNDQIHYPYPALKQTSLLQRFLGSLISFPFSAGSPAHDRKLRSGSHPLIDWYRLNSAASISCAILALLLLLLLPVVLAGSIDQHQSCGATFSTSCIGEGHVNYACDGHVIDNGCRGDPLVETAGGVRGRSIATSTRSTRTLAAKTSPSSKTPVTSPAKTPITTSPSKTPVVIIPSSVTRRNTTTPSTTFPSSITPPASSSSACLPSGIVCIILSLLVAIATAPYMLP